jgi:2-amino-4-hydroxy-6-hydroxymethyldihydropteridine diphosphokinase
VARRASRAFLGLGANLGDRAAALDAALARLDARGAGLRLVRLSPLYETEPLAPPDAAPLAAAPPAPWYLNRVAEIETTLAPRALLARLQDCEARVGRVAGRPRWAPREIDIDLLLFDDLVLREPDLVVPHAGLTRRRFVLAPLADIAPDLVVPGTGRTVAEHLAALTDPLRVILFGLKREERR